VKKIISIIIPSLLSFSFSAYADDVVKTFNSEKIKRLNLKNTSGDSLIVGNQMSKATVSVERVKWNDKCLLDITENSGTLTVEIRRESPVISFFGHECRGNIKINLPLTTDIESKSGSGDVSITEMHGNFQVTTGSGNLTIERAQITKLTADLGSGDLKVTGDIKDADIKVGSGDVFLTYQKVPTFGHIAIETGSGDATLSLPKESKLKVSLEAGSGKLSNELDNLQNAPYSISMTAGSGNLKVKKL
jgi:DUF4097 and DUF4098 domain-containing protein YvlB